MLITFNGTQFLWNQSCQKKRAQLKLLDLSLNNKTETLGKMVNGKEQYFLTTTTTYTLSLTQHLSQRPSNPMFFLSFFPFWRTKWTPKHQSQLQNWFVCHNSNRKKQLCASHSTSHTVSWQDEAWI